MAMTQQSIYRLFLSCKTEAVMNNRGEYPNGFNGERHDCDTSVVACAQSISRV
jgi:hypothetical protein